MQVHIIEMLKIWEDRLNAVGLQDVESDRHFHIIAVVMISNISNTRYLTFDKICKQCNDEQNQGSTWDHVFMVILALKIRLKWDKILVNI
jgi:hypothetical protein